MQVGLFGCSGSSNADISGRRSRNASILNIINLISSLKDISVCSKREQKEIICLFFEFRKSISLYLNLNKAAHGL